MGERLDALLEDKELAEEVEVYVQERITEHDIEEAKKKKEKAKGPGKKLPEKPKCFKKYPKDKSKVTAVCRSCWWAQVCKGKVKEAEHIEKMA